MSKARRTGIVGVAMLMVALTGCGSSGQNAVSEPPASPSTTSSPSQPEEEPSASPTPIDAWSCDMVDGAFPWTPDVTATGLQPFCAIVQVQMPGMSQGCTDDNAQSSGVSPGQVVTVFYEDDEIGRGLIVDEPTGDSSICEYPVAFQGEGTSGGIVYNEPDGNADPHWTAQIEGHTVPMIADGGCWKVAQCTIRVTEPLF